MAWQSGEVINSLTRLRRLSGAIPTSYTIFKINDTYYAETNIPGGTSYEDDDAATVIQAAIDALPNGGKLFFRKGLYEVDTEISWTADNITLSGEGLQNTEIRATSTINSIFNITDARYAHFDNLFINGYNNATIGINGLRSTSGVPVHFISNCAVWGAKTANIDLTGCEDSTLQNVWLDGRIANDTTTVYTDYGLKIGASGDGYKTGGHIKCFDVKAGFHKTADAWIKNVVDISFFGSLFSSKNTYSASLAAHVLLEGGTGAGAVLPVANFYDCWFENSGGSANNIKIQNTRASKLNFYGGGWVGADTGYNIYSDLNPALESLTAVGTHFERASGDYNIKCPATSIGLFNVRMYGGSGLDTTNVTRYIILDSDTSSILTNINWETENDLTLNGHYLNEVGRITNDSGSALEIAVQDSGQEIKFFDLGANEYMMLLTKDTIDFKDNVLKDPANEADATLSGTPRIVQIKIGSTPYYFKVYPTKS